MSEFKDEIKQIQGQIETLKYECRTPEQVKELLTANNVYYLSVLWVDFHLFLKTPHGTRLMPAKVLKPDVNKRLYPIFDYGDGWSTSRGEDLFTGIRSTGKYFRTIERLIGLFNEYLERQIEEDGNGGGESSVQYEVAFGGHELGKRKAFECIAALNKSVNVVNYEPGEWGGRRLLTLKKMVDEGYGLPQPRFS